MNTAVVQPFAPARQDLALELARTASCEPNETEKNNEDANCQAEWLEDSESGDDKFEGIIGRSPAMRALREQIKVVAPTNSTVLVLGETGTGKELIARAIHNLSSRRERPFIKVVLPEFSG
jgi:transcriptional regulator with GAF, ATPase, and Fis domain